MTARKLTVAAIQMACALGEAQDNLQRAAAFVEEAARRGAKLVLLALGVAVLHRKAALWLLAAAVASAVPVAVYWR